MVEPLSAGLIGLASLFSSCVECFSYIEAGRSLPAHLQTLAVKLDLKKAQLLIWGNAAGVLKTEVAERHPRLDEAATFKLVEKALVEIKSLLSDADALRAQYGLDYDVNTATPTGKDSDFHHDISSNSMGMFRMSWRRFCAKFSPDRPGISISKKTKWAILDKDKFEDLLDLLSNFLDDLGRVLPVEDRVNETIECDIASILDLSKLRLVQSAFEEAKNKPEEIAHKAASDMMEQSIAGTVDRHVYKWLDNIQPVQEVAGSEYRRLAIDVSPIRRKFRPCALNCSSRS
jgi:Prion-inhibition and propagation